MKTRFAVLLTVLVLGAFAFAAGPFTLGNVFRLGSSTTAGLPASSATIAGGLIYVSDDAGVLFNNGTAWVPLASGSSSGSNFWFDAGPGYIFENERILNPDSGVSLYVTNNGSTAVGIYPALVVASESLASGVNYSASERFVGGGGQSVGSIWASQTGNTTAFGIGLNLVGGGVGVNGGIVFANGGATGEGSGQDMLGEFNASKIFLFNQSSGADAIKFRTTGARAHLGNGSLDYLASDGTGLTTPGYVVTGDYTDGTTGLCTGAACLGTAFASFPAATGALASRLSFDSTANLWRFSNGTAWYALAPTRRNYVGCHFPLGFTTTSVDGCSFVGFAAADGNLGVPFIDKITPLIVGVGAGNITYEIFDTTTSTSKCSVAIACTATVGTSINGCSGGTAVAGDVLAVRINANACGTVPVTNITAGINYTWIN